MRTDWSIKQKFLENFRFSISFFPATFFIEYFQVVIKGEILEVRGLIWFDEIVNKLTWKHNVTCLEVKEVFASNPLVIFVEKGHCKGENLYVSSGSTEKCRYFLNYARIL